MSKKICKAEFADSEPCHFIVLAERHLYLGESKWDRSSEKIINGVLQLCHEQLLRHNLFRFYVEHWAFGPYSSWSEFEQDGLLSLKARGINKLIAPAKSQLASNLQTVLRIIREHFDTLPEIVDVLLYLHNRENVKVFPKETNGDFKVVLVDYSESTVDQFIQFRL